ncbi:hydroxyectoine utilization dehydratase EutB [Mesorhizobium sp. NZP2077]|uniref:hydroxyectoine utilization dehydratase EutB n=1 Tax=Mesorhizobium sp. NZP2077 TaxID=2483404 RepID=UPI00159ACA3E|nr:hydroxyectoine utilization dehydratase EutB [Mesorhizobium sp. NZP2077]QKD20572.1 hydroxyectoine utilization dehydratase EutB [Mesorhizobium sp. NZP2077]
MIQLPDINEARRRISDVIVNTPLVRSTGLSRESGVEVFLKMEHRQKTGSFKLRGATNAISQLTEAEKIRGVVTASTGNHGRAVSYAATAAKVRATICVSNLVHENKIAEIRRLGADLRIIGNSYDEAEQEAERLAEHDRMVMIHASDDPRIIAGQGTIGLELLEALPNVATVLVAVGSGGLSAGVGLAISSLRPSARILGVSMDRGAAMKASLEAGHPVEVEELPSLADALCGGIGLQNKLTFKACQSLLDDVILVSEEEIAAGIRYAYDHEHEVVEGAGAVGISALLAGKVTALKGPIAIIISGGNINMALHRRVMAGDHTIFQQVG